MPYTTIDDPTAYFQVKTYSGNATDDTTITLDGSQNMQPDFIWIKNRDTTHDHYLANSIIGSTKYLSSNTNASEITLASGVKSFTSNGFVLGTNNTVNKSGSNLVAWSWLAGGSASSNSNGSITSSVSANTTAGFSIVSYTGTGSTDTIGHGLGAKPSVILVKKRNGSANWYMYHHKNTSEPETDFLTLNSDAATSDNANNWNDTEPTSSVFSVGASGTTNPSSGTMIAYCFAEKKGYSKFGSYTGNGNADGPFVYTGFKPAFLLLKRSDASGASWQIIDNKRSDAGGNNVIDKVLAPNGSDAEYDEGSANWFADFVSNGFKLRNSLGASNTSGATHIYMAFAESPFVTSTGIPTTAR